MNSPKFSASSSANGPLDHLEKDKIFLFEFDEDCLPVDRPRHCLPHAVINFVKRPEATTKATTSKSSTTINNSSRSRDPRRLSALFRQQNNIVESSSALIEQEAPPPAASSPPPENGGRGRNIFSDFATNKRDARSKSPGRLLRSSFNRAARGTASDWADGKGAILEYSDERCAVSDYAYSVDETVEEIVSLLPLVDSEPLVEDGIPSLMSVCTSSSPTFSPPIFDDCPSFDPAYQLAPLPPLPVPFERENSPALPPFPPPPLPPLPGNYIDTYRDYRKTSVNGECVKVRARMSVGAYLRVSVGDCVCLCETASTCQLVFKRDCLEVCLFEINSL